MSRRNKCLVVLASVVVAGAGAAIGLSVGGGGLGSGRGAGSPALGTRTTVVSGATTSTESAAPGTGTRSCTMQDLRLTVGPQREIIGYVGMPLVFTNKSATSCGLSGYPTVLASDASGMRVGVAVQIPGGVVGGVGPNGTPGTVVVGPGASASAEVEAAGNAAKGTGTPKAKPGPTTTSTQPKPCPVIAKLAVSVPGSASVMDVSFRLVDCFGFQVNPFVMGNSGSST